MRRRSWVVCVALVVPLAGCDLVFGIDPRPPDDQFFPHDTDGFFPYDTDGDGVLDGFDNCPVPNPRQLDEDGDLVGDVCDNCPGIANTTQDDFNELPLAADGVGDRCDPHPGEIGDFFVGRYFMDGGDDPADWMPIAGAWVVAADTVISTDPEAAVATLRYPVQLSADAVIEVGVAVSSMGAMAEGEHQAAGVWIDVDADLPDGRLCEVRREPEQPTMLALAHANPNTQSVIYSAEYPTSIEATDSVLRVQRVTAETGVSYECYDPLITGEPGNLFIVGGNAADNGVGFLGLYTTNAAAAFRYVVIYDR